MPSTLADDAKPARTEASHNQAKINTSIENGGDGETAKNLNDLSILADSTSAVDGKDSVDERLTAEAAKAAAARAKKTAMNKRKRENARRNKAEAQEKQQKAEEESACLHARKTIIENDQLRSLFSGDTPPSVFDPALIKELGKFKDVLGISSEQVEQFQTMMGSMSTREKEDFKKIMSELNVSDDEYRNCVQNGVMPRDVVEPDGPIEGDTRLVDDPNGPPFLVRPVSGKGLGVIATRSIKKGTEIFREVCLLETKTGSSQTWIQVEASVNVISPENKQKYLALAEECGCQGNRCVETRIMRIWRANAFHNRIATSRGEYVYEIASRLNHSCIPNSYYSFTKNGHIVFFASRDIQKGVEITHDYRGAFGTVDKRRKMLLERYGFTCQCTACRDSFVISPSHVMDAMRRGEMAEVKSKGTTLLGGQTPAEIAALRLVAAWTEKIMKELNNLELKMQLAVIMHAPSPDRLPDANSWVVKQHVDLIRRYLKSQNYFGLTDDFFDTLFARLVPKILGIVQNAVAKSQAK